MSAVHLQPEDMEPVIKRLRRAHSVFAVRKEAVALKNIP